MLTLRGLGIRNPITMNPSIPQCIIGWQTWNFQENHPHFGEEYSCGDAWGTSVVIDQSSYIELCISSKTTTRPNEHMHTKWRSDTRFTLFDISGRTTVRVAYQPSVVLEYQVQFEGLKAKHKRKGEEKPEQMNIGYASPCGARITRGELR